MGGTDPGAQPEPPEWAFRAYLLSRLLGMKQEHIKIKLKEETGQSFHQGTISRNIKRVERFLGKHAPNLGIPGDARTKPKMVTTPPNVIDAGRRLDGLTKRQREKQSDDRN